MCGLLCEKLIAMQATLSFTSPHNFIGNPAEKLNNSFRRDHVQELNARLSLACALVNSGNNFLAKKIAREVALSAQSKGMYIEFEARAFLGVIAYDQGDWTSARLHFFQAKASLYPQHPNYSSDCRYIDSLLKRLENRSTPKQTTLTLAA